VSAQANGSQEVGRHFPTTVDKTGISCCLLNCPAFSFFPSRYSHIHIHFSAVLGRHSYIRARLDQLDSLNKATWHSADITLTVFYSTDFYRTYSPTSNYFSVAGLCPVMENPASLIGNIAEFQKTCSRCGV
jgi:hypothetical protein